MDLTTKSMDESGMGMDMDLRDDGMTEGGKETSSRFVLQIVFTARFCF